MAANFWASTQNAHWLLDKEKVFKSFNMADRKYMTIEEIIKARVYYTDVLQLLGRLVQLRQRVVASATTYFRRFYVNNSFIDFDPRLIAPTCLYLASKVEECITHACIFEKAMKSIDKEWPYSMTEILEAEYYILEEMEFYLVLYHPYHPLITFLAEAELGECLETAWHLVNDTYRTDIALCHPPYIIALACILVASHKQHLNVRAWLANLNVDMKDVWMVLEELLHFYTMWAKVTEEEIKAILRKITTQWEKPKQGVMGLPKPSS